MWKKKSIKFKWLRRCRRLNQIAFHILHFGNVVGVFFLFSYCVFCLHSFIHSVISLCHHNVISSLFAHIYILRLWWVNDMLYAIFISSPRWMKICWVNITINRNVMLQVLVIVPIAQCSPKKKRNSTWFSFFCHSALLLWWVN